MLVSSLLFITLIQLALAFNDFRPSFIDKDDSYYVSAVEKMPEYFAHHIKQQVLGNIQTSSAVRNSTATTNSSYNSTPASSTISIETETMTAGMTYLYSNNQDEAFHVNITLNAKDYPVLIDTGSPYLWLYSSNCTDKACTDKELFDASKATKLNGTFNLSYDSGIASGPIYEDSIIIAGFETENFAFGVANDVPDLFTQYNFAGVLGLPADNASITGLVNAVSFLSENGDITSSKFTILMGEYESDSENSGLLFLGSTKDNLHVGEIYTSPIIEEAVSHWEFKIDNIYVDDFAIEFDSITINGESSNYSRIGLLDSGTSSIVLPLTDANKFHSFFENSITDGQNYAILCNSTLDFEFEISGKNWTLTPEYYIGSAYPTNTELNGYCVSNIQGLDSAADDAWILGILFMKDRYVEFDYENQWIGLAERNNNLKFVNAPVKSKNNNTSISETTIITSSTTSSTLSSLSSSSSIISTTSSHSNIAINIKPTSNKIWSLSFMSLIFYNLF